jgi:hypothetical protein
MSDIVSTEPTESAADYCRTLRQQAEAHHRQAATACALVVALPKGAPAGPEHAAWLGHSMAAEYAAGLAEAISRVELLAGTEAADRLTADIRAEDH